MALVTLKPRSLTQKITQIIRPKMNSHREYIPYHEVLSDDLHLRGTVAQQRIIASMYYMR